MRIILSRALLREHIRGILRWSSHLFLVLGLLALSYDGAVWANTHLYQAYEDWRLERTLMDQNAPPGSLIGRLQIPRIGLSAIVLEGVDARTLQLGPGHIPGTAFPGRRGNVGIAGHRDTFFRSLRKARLGDTISLTTPRGSYAYRVEATEVVDPNHVEVLAPSRQPVLTLVTCHPFSYVGSAPDRFVVRARLMGGHASSAVEQPAEIVWESLNRIPLP
jgi:sortase A